MNTEIANDGVADGLPTALDVALEKAKYDAAPLTTRAWQKLRGDLKHAPPECLRDGQRVDITPRTVQAVTFDIGVTLYNEETLAKLRDVQACMLAGVKVLERHSLANTATVQNKVRDEIAERMGKGEPTEGMVIPSRESVQRTLLSHISAGRAALVKLTDEQVRPLCQPILQVFITALETYMRDTETQDRLDCEAFGLQYKPCLRWQACFCIAETYSLSRALPLSNSWKLPSDILAGIVDL